MHFFSGFPPGNPTFQKHNIQLQVSVFGEQTFEDEDETQISMPLLCRHSDSWTFLYRNTDMMSFIHFFTKGTKTIPLDSYKYGIPWRRYCKSILLS